MVADMSGSGMRRPLDEVTCMWNPFSRSRSTTVLEPLGSNSAIRSAHFSNADEVVLRELDFSKSAPEIAQIEKIGSIAVITVTVPELARHRDASLLADLLDQVVESDIEHVVIDLQNVMFMDSGCVGCLVEALNRMSSSGGRIALANPASSVVHMFRITRLDRVFPVCSDVLAAITAVERNR